MEAVARSVQYTSQHNPLASWMIPAGLRTLSSSVGECTISAVMSSNLMYLASFMFLLAANVNSVRATARGGVLAKASSRAPYATCCATQYTLGSHHRERPDFQVLRARLAVPQYPLGSHLRERPPSPSHTTSNTLWSCMCLTSLARAFLLTASRGLALVYSMVPVTSPTPQCRPTLLYQGLRRIELSNRCAVWFAFGGS